MGAPMAGEFTQMATCRSECQTILRIVAGAAAAVGWAGAGAWAAAKGNTSAAARTASPRRARTPGRPVEPPLTRFFPATHCLYRRHRRIRGRRADSKSVDHRRDPETATAPPARIAVQVAPLRGAIGSAATDQRVVLVTSRWWN